ncbi:hypothetical protein J1614_007279 [Plenodomus biglobosus]|nr:hypothetical protein J1614_007279 [Plenodomus biglobosus]
MADVLPSSNEIAGDAGTARASDDSRKNKLVEELDELLERYLHTLDEYQRVRSELSNQLSSGFMSLAQANFHNSSSAIRYGKDCYDDRMQAIRRVHMSEILDDSSRSGRSHFSIKLRDKSGSTESSKSEVPKEKEIPEEHASDTSSPDLNEESAQEPEQDKEESINGNVKPPDPLRWFGILVPPALRTAQSTFIAATEGPIARLATVAIDLRSQEIEIGRMRKQIKKIS